MKIDYYSTVWVDAQVRLWDCTEKEELEKAQSRLESIKQMAKRAEVYEEVEKQVEMRIDDSIFNPKNRGNILM